MSLIVRDSGRRWINGVIPFKEDKSLDSDPGLKSAILQARLLWESATPVRFVPQMNEPDFVVFKNVPGTTRCSAAAGRKGGAQEIKCANKSTPAETVRSLVHEIGHAIGLQHEHQRQDRDALMAVSATAIAQLPQDYARLDGEQMVGPYDLDSIMHYRWSTPTMQRPLTKITPFGPAVWRDPAAWPDPTPPSAGDAEGIRFMYGIVPDRTPIAVMQRHDEHMELWVVGGDGIVRGAWFDGMWRSWYQLPERTFPQRGHLAVLGRHRDHMEVFGIGTDGQLHGVWWDGQWHEWYTLGAPTIPNLPPGTTALPPGAPLAVRSRFDDHMEVWVVGADRQVHGIWWDGNTWQGWYTLPGALFPVGAPLAVHSRNDDHMELWGVEENARLQHTWWDGNWQGWHLLPTPTAGPEGFRLMPGGHVAVLGRNDDHMEVWSIGTDNRMHGIWWDGNWHDWYTLAGPVSFPPGAPLTALSRHDDHMEVYSVTDANQLQGIWWDGNWHQWFVLDPLPVASETPLAALSRNSNHMELWCVAPAGALPDDVGAQGVWWDGSSWKGFYRVT